MIKRYQTGLKSTITTALLMTALCACSGGCSEQPGVQPPLPNLSLTGFEAPVAKHLEAAYREAAKDSVSASANAGFAMALHAYELYEPAEQVYGRVRRLAPEEFRWRYLHGVVLQELGKNDSALQAFRSAEMLDKNYSPLRLRIAALMLEKGDLALSREIYTSLLQVRPAAAQAYYGLAQTWLRDGNKGEAAKALKKAIAMVPAYGTAHYALASILRELGADERVAYHLEQFELNKDARIGVDDALLNEIRALGRGEGNLYANGVRYIQQGRVRDAVGAFEKVLALNPEHYNAHINLIGLYSDMEQFEQSEKHFEAARLIEPQNAKLYINIGVARLRNNAIEGAAAAFATAVEVDPQYATGWRNLGKMQQQLGRNAAARASYQQAVTLDASDRQSQYFYGRFLIDTGEPAAAIAPLTRALTPETVHTPHYMRVLAEAQAGTGDKVLAADTLRRARKIAARTQQAQLILEIDADLAELAATP